MILEGPGGASQLTRPFIPLTPPGESLGGASQRLVPNSATALFNSERGSSIVQLEFNSIGLCDFYNRPLQMADTAGFPFVVMI